MIKITFLGTGSMQPTKQRNQSGFLLEFKGENLLFDCGEGTQRQLRMAGLKPAKISKLMISHWHGDHTFGIPGLINALGADEYQKKLLIFGPKGTKKYFLNIFQSFDTNIKFAYEIREVSSGKIFENEDYFIKVVPLKHSSTCIGYSFVEKDKRRINLKKAKKLNLSGPVLGKLQKGKTISAKGKKIRPEMVTYLVKGKKISYVADTLPCKGVNDLAVNADLLISEGTHLDNIKERTKKYMHLTIKQAADFARKNKAKKLIITHLSPRYNNSQEPLKEARKYFRNSLIAEDFLKIEI